jgi:hypothetical protein
MAMFTLSPMNPKMNRDAERANTEVHHDREHRDAAYSIIETTLMNLLPKRSTAHPANGNAMKEPRGSMKSTPPSSASFRSNLSLNTGIREAQLEKIKPQKKNKTATA